MSLNDVTDMTNTFKSITKCSDEVASKFLKQSNWNLDLAITTYYDAQMDSDGDTDIDPNVERSSADDDSDVPILLPGISLPRMSATSSGDATHSTSADPEPHKERKKPHITTNRIQTLRDLKVMDRKRESSGSSDDSQGGQAFYAGGAEGSGQQVLGPRRQDDVVSEIFRQGIEVPRSSVSRQRHTFSGVGYILGNSSASSRPVGPPSGGGPVEVSLKFWKNGFSFNDGTFYAYNTPQSDIILSSIRRGEIPDQLGNFGDSEVQLNIEDRREVTFAKTKSNANNSPFVGSGRVLGSGAVVSGQTSVQQNETQSDSASSADVSKPPTSSMEMQIDDSEPITNIQIRLEDGSRLIGRFNTTHTIRDIRDFVIQSRPNYAGRPFTLVHGFPRVEFANFDQTIAEAGIENTALFQRID